jgi:hypothetical protein
MRLWTTEVKMNNMTKAEQNAVLSKNTILTALSLIVYLDGKKFPLLQNMVLTTGIREHDDILLTVDGDVLEQDTEEVYGKNISKIKTSKHHVTGEDIPVITTLRTMAINRGLSRVVVKKIEISADEKIILNLVSMR